MEQKHRKIVPAGFVQTFFGFVVVKIIFGTVAKSLCLGLLEYRSLQLYAQQDPEGAHCLVGETAGWCSSTTLGKKCIGQKYLQTFFSVEHLTFLSSTMMAKATCGFCKQFFQVLVVIFN